MKALFIIVLALLFSLPGISNQNPDSLQSIKMDTLKNIDRVDSILVQPEKQKKKHIEKQEIEFDSQCHATTKKGKRCKRTISSGRYCWQHKK